MKILHVSTGYPLSYPGGITNYVRASALAQAKIGHQVHVIAQHETKPSAPAPYTLVEYQSKRIIPFALKNVESDSDSEKILDYIACNHFDLIHFHMALDLPLDFFRRFSRMKVPYVVSLHDYFYICPRIIMVDQSGAVCRQVDLNKCATCVGLLDQIRSLKSIARRVGIQLPRIKSSAASVRMEAMKCFLQNANMLLPVSNRTAEIYKQIVPHGRFRVEQIGNESALALQTQKSPSEKIRFTFLGTLNKAKGAEVFQWILQNVTRADFEFHFYGRAYEEFDKTLSRLGLIVHGSYQPNDVPTIMANTDIGMVLSTWEDAGPQVAMEFINYGIPVIGTRRGGIPDIVSEDSGFLLDPENPKDFERLAAWMNRMDRAELENISRRIRRLRTPDEHALQINNVYEQVVHAKNC